MERKTVLPVKPILVTGSPRSGTTWVGRMLATSPQLYYIHEPFNPDCRPGGGICNVRFKHHQTYITEENERDYYEPVKQMIQGKYNLFAAMLEARSLYDLEKIWDQKKAFREYRRRKKLPLIKDPIALMSAGWMSRRFDINVVVMIRHPAAFVASMKRLGWGFDPLNWALSQELLLRDFLSHFKSDLVRLKKSKSDIIDQTALLWKIAYFVVLRYKKKYPHWLFLKHEDLSRDPLNHFRQLFAALGLKFTDETKKMINEYSNESNPSHSTGGEKLLKLNSRKVISYWKKNLSINDIKRIKEIVGDVSTLFYSERDWELSNTSQ